MVRRLIAAPMATAVLAISTSAAVVGATSRAASALASGATPPPAVSPASIPVLDWHELDNGCASTAAVCNSPDPESVSTAQLTDELDYLRTNGYHTISPAQYRAWTQGSKATLPANPVLLVADNGIENFLAGAQPLLKQNGFTAAAALVTGFADGAGGICRQPVFEPGCPGDNMGGGWDATWTQLGSHARSGVYQFILESGTAGHFVQTYDPACTAFYACMLPGETEAAYEARVQSDLTSGQAEIISKLGASHFTAGLWVVPYSDDGYAGCTSTGCTPQPYDAAAGWLPSWTASTFPVAFVEDAFRNGVQHERYRFDVKSWMSLSQFADALTSHLAAGDFTLTHTPGTPVLPPPPPPPPVSTNPVAALPVLALDSATLTLAQVVAQLSYLQAAGFHAISAANYVSWAEGNTTPLPTNPILITVTGGRNDLLATITPYLISAGYRALDFVSTAQADAGGLSATWAQLAALSPSAWQFSFSSGAAGGTKVATDSSTCDIFYACQAPGEASAAYQARVAGEIGAGRLAFDNGLWMQTVNDFLWSPPFGDAGQSGQEYNGPPGWLAQWASYVFPVVLVAGGANGNDQHNVLGLTGTTTEVSFETTLKADLADGTFNR